MQLICISRGSFSHGTELSERLARKLGYPCLSRESITDDATTHGIPVGRIEMAIVRRRPITDRLAIEIDRFKAFVTRSLCERALDESLIYHGRTGHLVLPNVDHVFRVRVIADLDQRIRTAADRMHIDWKKAREYVSGIDEDIRRWVSTQYGVDWESPVLYDMVVNCSNRSVENIATGLMHISQLPEYAEFPASRRNLEDLLLASRCRLAIGADPRTRDINVRVRAERGIVTCTFQPWQAEDGRYIPDVLDTIPGIESLTCTGATTNILLVGEHFDPTARVMTDVVDLASRWHAAVEMVQLHQEEGADAGATPQPRARVHATPEDGGILDDTEEQPAGPDTADFEASKDLLIRAGCFGGYFDVPGGAQGLVHHLEMNPNGSLIVLGDLFRAKEEQVSKRLTRELAMELSDCVRIPVVEPEVLQASYLTSTRQWTGVLLYGGIAAAVFALVFAYQEPLLRYLGRPLQDPGVLSNLGTSVSVAVVVPIVAFVIGAFWHNVLRILKME